MAKAKKTLQYGVLNSNLHTERFLRSTSGETIADIAKDQGVTEKAILRSIADVKLYRSRNTHENVNQAISAVILSVAKELQNAVSQALKATFDVKDGDKTVKEADHSTRLRAAAEIRQLAQVVQPKSSPSTNVSVGVGVTQQTRVASGGYVGMEDRLRQIRQQRSEQTVLEGSTVAVAELEQPGGEFAVGDDQDDAE